MNRRHTIVRATDDAQDARHMPDEIRDACRAHARVRSHIHAAYATLPPSPDMPYLARRVCAHARSQRSGRFSSIYARLSHGLFPRYAAWCASCAAALLILALVFVPLVTTPSHAEARESFVLYHAGNGHVVYQYIEYEDDE